MHKRLFSSVRKVSISVDPRSPLELQQCPECQAELGAANEVYSRIAVCDYCDYHFVWSALKRVEHLADPGSFKATGHAIQSVDVLGFVDEKQSYAVKLSENQKQTRLSDAILSGRCSIGGIKTVLAVLDFRFMGGSMGSVVGEQITVAFEYATKHRLPVVTVVNSGGARMQEGIISLMQMPKTAAATCPQISQIQTAWTVPAQTALTDTRFSSSGSAHAAFSQKLVSGSNSREIVGSCSP